ncbi:MAG: ATP-dependent DNA ligase [Acidimicrobiales bacterium]
MRLPVMPPVKPMLAKLARALPESPGLSYEPKWDGFRCIVFRDHDEVELGSRNERPLTRYFPELMEPLRSSLPPAVVLDGEIVIATDEGLDFEALQQRIHPAESRVRTLAARTPASYVAFDLLALGDEDLRNAPFAERRRRLAECLRDSRPPVHLTPATQDRGLAEEWFRRFEGAGLDGVVAKAPALPYREDQRTMIKVKHERTADCVVGGFRWHTSGPIIGSLLLGLYDEDAILHHIGVIGAFPMSRRREMVEELAPYREGAAVGHPWAGWAEAQDGARAGGPAQRLPGAHSRWSAGRSLGFEVVRPELVVEVAYDHLQGSRLRHAGQFRRWRPDRDPRSCTYAQLDTAVPEELSAVFGAGG